MNIFRSMYFFKIEFFSSVSRVKCFCHPRYGRFKVYSLQMYPVLQDKWTRFELGKNLMIQLLTLGPCNLQTAKAREKMDAWKTRLFHNWAPSLCSGAFTVSFSECE